MVTNPLVLPQIHADFHHPLPSLHRLLVLGGRPPAASWLQQVLRQQPTPELWAIDHGVDACRSADACPTVLLGDADSASPANWAWGCTHAASIERHPVEKDLTDTQLALSRAAASTPAVLILTGAFGGRFDHAFSTVFSAAQQPGTCLLADERESMLFVHDKERLSVTCRQPPTALSLLPLTAEVQGVTLRGTHWPLENATLTQAQPNTISNVLEPGSHSFDISVGRGVLGVHLVFPPDGRFAPST